MMQIKVVKSALAASAFFGGLVVAQYLQPMSTSGHDIQDSLLVAQADAVPAIRQVAAEQTVYIPIANELSVSSTNRPERLFAEKRNVPNAATALKTDNDETVDVANDQLATSDNLADDKPSISSPQSADGPELFGYQAPIEVDDTDIKTIRPLLTDLPTLGGEPQGQTLGAKLPGQFAPITAAISRKVTVTPADQNNAVAPPPPQIALAAPDTTDLAVNNVALPEKTLRTDAIEAAEESDDPDKSGYQGDLESADDSQRLSPEMAKLRGQVQEALDIYRNREISVNDKSAWSIMHSLIGYGVKKKVRVSGGKRASAIGWICYNNPCRGVRLFYLKNNQIYGRLGPGNQGHEGQFLAMLAQSRVRSDFPMKVSGKDFTIADLIEREKLSCRANSELTFKLIGLSHYEKFDAKWKSDIGEEWDIPRLIKEEMRQPIVGAACGGTHRLFGLSYAINRCVHQGEPISGQYRRARVYLDDYHNYTFKLQNPDGSFSTQFFTGRGAASDEERRLLTTGHISEWLSFSLKREELNKPKMVKAIDYLSSLLVRGKNRQWEVGPLGHALHALNIYNSRVFESTAPSTELAASSND